MNSGEQTSLAGGQPVAQAAAQAGENDTESTIHRAPKKPRRRGRVTVFGKWCKGCGICIAFCPQQVFEMAPDGHPIVSHEERCTACNWCYYHCPDCAILIEIIEGDEQPIDAHYENENHEEIGAEETASVAMKGGRKLS